MKSCNTSWSRGFLDELMGFWLEIRHKSGSIAFLADQSTRLLMAHVGTQLKLCGMVKLCREIHEPK